MEKLQQQLNALRQKAFKIRRMKRGEKEGLLDSGGNTSLEAVEQGRLSGCSFRLFTVRWSRSLALQLIDKIEAVKKGMKFQEKESFAQEVQWVRDLVEAHPVLSGPPTEVTDCLAVSPGPWSSLPANRRRRKAMKRDGFACHLYDMPVLTKINYVKGLEAVGRSRKRVA